jgi:hypothetical protein
VIQLSGTELAGYSRALQAETQQGKIQLKLPGKLQYVISKPDAKVWLVKEDESKLKVFYGSKQNETRRQFHIRDF